MTITRKYDADSHILYLSVGQPRPAISVSLPLGVLVRSDKSTGEFVGVTFIDFEINRRSEYEKVLVNSHRVPEEILPRVLENL
jgi:hypothetical protein